MISQIFFFSFFFCFSSFSLVMVPTFLLLVFGVLGASLTNAGDFQQSFDEIPSPLLEPWYNVFTQFQDHFDSGNQNTFPQRFSVDTTHYEPGGPIFFYLAGEAPMEFFRFQESFIANQLAEDNGAIFVVLEHRYYGKSFPVSDLSTENLQFLSSQQALADAAFFLEKFRNGMNNSVLCCPSNAIVFGCSYSGALSSWFRQKYPELVTGSIAPSGPVEAIYNYSSFFGLFEQVTGSYPGCSDRVSEAISQISQMLTTSSGRQQLAETFNMCVPLAEDGSDDYFFKHMISLIIASAPQFHNPPGWELTGTCEILTNATLDPVTAYAQAVDYNKNYDPAAGLQDLDLGCYVYSQKAHIDGLRLTSLSSPSANGRSWFWQKCNEFGFFQTSYPGTSIFFDDLTLGPLEQNCALAYGVPGLLPHVDQTNSYYGGKSPNSTEILYTNGDFDPWHLQSITTSSGSLTASTYAAGHCAPMDSPTDVDPPSLRQTREDIQRTVNRWVRS